MKKSITLLGFLILMIQNSSAYADTYCGTRIGVGKGNITATYQSSLTGSYATLFDSVISNWNGISSAASIKKSATFTTGNDKYFVGDNPNAANGYGAITVFYKKDASGSIVGADWNEDYEYSIVTYYKNVTDAFSNDIQKGVVQHELGHTLHLAHSTSNDSTCRSAVAVPSGTLTAMKTNTTYFTLPTSYDKAELKSKWGN